MGKRWAPKMRSISGLGFLMLMSGGANAFMIGTSNPDLEMHWDNTLSYNAGMRAQGPITGIINSPTFGESDNKFSHAGQLFENRVDVVSEFDLTYKNMYGFRVSGEGWYDNAYHNSSTGPAAGPASVGIPSAYGNGTYSSYTKRYYEGPSAQLLDAFAFSSVEIGDIPVNIKVGQTSVYWGEALFNTANSVAYAQGPIDINKAVTSPGAKLNQLFLPISQISLQSQVTPTVSLAAQYFLDWAPNRYPEGGTYFGTASFLFNGPNQLFTGNPQDPFLYRQDPLKPSYSGNFGLNARWQPSWLGGGTLGLYFRRLAETAPYQAPQVGASGYRLVYNDNVKLYGASLSKTVGDVSVGAEMNYRVHTALVNTGINPTTNQGPLGNIFSALVNSTYLLPKTALWDTGSLAAELTYVHLQKVTANPDLFNGVGFAACEGGGTSTGCSTRNSLGLNVNFAPQYLQAFPGVDLTVPITVGAGLAGTGPNNGASAQNSWNWQIGLQALVRQQYTISLYYGGFHSKYKQTSATGSPVSTITGAGPFMYNDRGYVLLTLQSTF